MTPPKPRTLTAALKALAEHARHHGYQPYPIVLYRALQEALEGVDLETSGYLQAAVRLLIADEEGAP